MQRNKCEVLSCNRIRFKLTISSLIVCLLFAFCGCDSKEIVDSKVNAETKVVLTTGFNKNELFKIDDTSCNTSEFKLYVTNIKNKYQNVYGKEIFQISGNSMHMDACMKEIAMSRISQVKTMNLLAKTYAIDLNYKEIENIAEISKQYYKSLNEEELNYLQVSEKVVEQCYTEYHIAHKVYKHIIEEMNPEISDDEARSVIVDWIYMDKNGNDALKKKAMKDIYDRIKNGEDFNSLATTYSEDKTISNTISKGIYDKEIEECVFNLANEEISKVVETDTGYYIIRCVNTLDRQVTDENKEKIVAERKKEAFNEVYGSFVKERIKQLNMKLWEGFSVYSNEQIQTDNFFDLYLEKFNI